MAISLVTNIPYQLIVRSIEYVMKGHGQFNHTKAGRKMATMNAYHINNILPQLVDKLVQLFSGKLFKIGGGIDRL